MFDDFKRKKLFGRILKKGLLFISCPGNKRYCQKGGLPENNSFFNNDWIVVTYNEAKQ